MPRADAAPSARRTKVRIAALVALALVAVCIYAIDQIAKYLVSTNLTEYETVPVLGQLLQLHYVKNPGAAFSIGTGSTWIFAIIATAVVIFIVGFAHRIRSIGWAVLFGLLLGGNAGNLTDRLIREPGFGVGHVVDFFQLWGFPAIFNVADTAIVASMVIFIVLTIRGVRLDGRKVPRKSETPDNVADADEPTPITVETVDSTTGEKP